MVYHKYMAKPFCVEAINIWGELRRFFEANPGEAILRAKRFKNTPNMNCVQILFPGPSGKIVYLYRNNQEEVNIVMGVQELPGSRGNLLSGSSKQFFAEYHIPFDVVAISEREENDNFSKKNDKYYERKLTLRLTQNTHEAIAYHAQKADPPTLPEDGTMILPLRDTFNQENDYRAAEFAYVEEQLASNGAATDMTLRRIQSGNNTLYKLGIWDGHF